MADPKRQVGRPPVTGDEDPPRVNLTLDSKDLAQTRRLAAREGITVGEVLRRGLKRLLRDNPSDE